MKIHLEQFHSEPSIYSSTLLLSDARETRNDGGFFFIPDKPLCLHARYTRPNWSFSGKTLISIR